MKTYFLQAIRGITHNKSRTFLTTLGIMIGIGTVIMVFSAGEGFKSYINSQVELYGTNTIFVEVQVPVSTKTRNAENSSVENHMGSAVANSTVTVTSFKKRDIEDIKNLSNVKNAYGAVYWQAVATFENVSKTAYILGADASRFDIDKGVLSAGRPYTEEEDSALTQVAVLGNNLAKNLFGDNDPLGSLIRVGNYNFEVIGVYEKRGGLGALDDDQIFIPLKTLQKKISGADHLMMGVVEIIDQSKADTTSLDIKDIMRRNHNITDASRDDFTVMTTKETMDVFNTVLSAITFLLIAIALISLIVGGVGVMNIMYVVVTERIGEIGLKKALGAQNKDILFEFLIEAIILTLMGGIIGIALGASMSYIVAVLAQSFNFVWKFSVPIYSIVLSVSISMLIGIVFGVFPARSASKLNPIEALNKE
ncbi:MAG: ABC transporter permease [Candidatus Paceibacterota bacterium]|jgi:ABC-type antimicrobial peptide transport system permease subunit